MAVVVVALALAVLLVGATWHLAQQRTLRRRLDALAERVGAVPVEGPAGIDALLRRLERTADTVGLRLDASMAEALRAAQALDAIPQGVVICDRDGAVVLRNRAATDFVGARHADAIVEETIHTVLNAARWGATQQTDLDVLGPPRRVLVISGLPVGTAEGGALAIIEDVSERRRLEAVRRDFVSNLSHELKTPIGAVGLLAETIAAEDDPAVNRRLAERMSAEAHRVGRIIEDLLALSRIEAEERPVREPVPVTALVEDAADRIRPVAERRSIEVVTTEVRPAHVVRGDRRQLVSALANLLENACKYSDEGSTVEVASRSDGTWIEIAVRDQGIGIPTADLDRVFERFYRVDRARSRETGGTGLGLSIVRHVAGNHRGDVRVESHEGVGSTFTLRLPSGTAPEVAR